jgi:hypothetical protein
MTFAIPCFRASIVLASAENGFLPGQRTPERPVAIHLEAQGVAETPAFERVKESLFSLASGHRAAMGE